MKIAPFMVALGLLTSCVTPDIAVNKDLKENSEAFEAKGRQGLMINQKLSFGGYSTGTVNRGWATKWEIPFIVTFRGSKEKLQFTQHEPGGKHAEVLAVSKFKSNEINLMNSYFGIQLKYENSFAGTVYNPENTDIYWDFIIHNVDASFGDRSGGFAKSKNGDIIEIRGVKTLDQSGIPNPVDVYGYEFWQDGAAVAAVSLINKGKVWIRKDVSVEQRLILGALASSLMLRNNQIDEFDSN